MPAAGAGEFDPRLFEMFQCASDVLGHVQRAVRMASARGPRVHGPGAHGRGRGPGAHGGPWSWEFGGPRGRKQWAGGVGGQWGAWWPPGPGQQRGPKASRGDVRAAILALLREGPRNGYQIMSEIEERSGGAWRPSPGAVYPALAQLADEGLIAAEESGGRRTFSLTEAGRRYIEENPDMARGAWESMGQQEHGDWQVPGLFAEAARLGAGIVQMAHAGSPEQLRAAEQLLKRTRRRLYQILADDFDDEADEEGATDSEPGEQG